MWELLKFTKKEMATSTHNYISEGVLNSTEKGRAWQPTPVFLPGEFHGQRSLVGYSPWGHKELNSTDATSYACMLSSIWAGHVLYLVYYMT